MKIARTYKPGSILDLCSDDKNDDDSVSAVSLKIASQLGSVAGRHAQVFKCILEKGTLQCRDNSFLPRLNSGSFVVAKVFDPDIVEFSDGEWLGTVEKFIEYLTTNETKAYTMLSSINGTHVPPVKSKNMYLHIFHPNTHFKMFKRTFTVL